MGQTPRQAIEDPDLPFNLSVMRASDAARAFKFNLMHAQLDKDDFGIAHVINMLKMVHEDS